ncbi:DNA-binding response regulator [Dehalococcoides mccartyi]|jgi:two-component system KDP operon response regulator KdpE|uniref:DNA-binding response regulator n=1 Tax=Dehalococcoides mccartyi TaxID=61435 RepID=A0A328ENI8_9CHLR|nr:MULTISPECIES: response regulator transcription factor [Dehalococcoides]AGG06958.1 signal transduction response regulator, OmpR family [Dehalococcoides mccartyi DCMB5]RAL70210.1 DNA-binding response regulator [Dehalococcoides mccartyi]
MKILIIEDDKEIAECIQLAFRVGWPFAQIITTNSGQKGLQHVEEDSPDAILLDLGLPDIDGIDVLKQIRSFSNIPIVIMTVRTAESNIVRGLEAGADEYICKPFGQMELLARLKATLRRNGPVQGNSTVMYGPLNFSYSYRTVQYNGREIYLTTTEGLILKKLAENAGNIVSYETLSETIWGESYTGAVDSLRVYVLRLRRKLEVDPSHPTLIISHANLGYSIQMTCPR